MLFVSSADERSRANGDAAAAHALAEELARVDQERWGHLLPTLREVAAAVAPRFADVMSADDVLGELVLASWDVWLADWSSRVLRCEEHRSLQVFLRDRLRDHLREQRRKLKRRRVLLTPTGFGPSVETGNADQPIAPAMFSTEPPAPDQGLSADELRREASSDAQTRAVIALRESGFTQEEIARVLRVSRPTVTRRLGAISAALLALLAAVAFAWAVTIESGSEPSPDTAFLEPEPLDPNAEPNGDAPSPPALEAPNEGRPGAPGLDPAEAPARATERLGRVTITSVAPCNIFIDGLARGLTPVRERLTAGEHELEARRDGYGVHRQAFRVSAGGTTRVLIGRDVWPGPVATADQSASREARARECTMRSDNRCVIALLEGQAETSIELRLLIEAYRATGDTEHAFGHMMTYVGRFPDRPATRQYEQILARNPSEERSGRGARPNRPAREYRPPAAGSDHGTLTINTMPWTRVFVDGRDTGRNTPMRNLRVTPGRHRIGLRTVDGTMHHVFVTVERGENTRIVRQL